MTSEADGSFAITDQLLGTPIMERHNDDLYGATTIASTAPLIPSTSASSPANNGSVAEEEEDSRPDRVLARFGDSNPFLWMIFVSCAFVWFITALPVMISAFFLGDSCDGSANCTVAAGSLIADFDLTGPRSHLAEFSTMVFVVGNMIGASTISRLSDIKGRRPALLLSLLGVGILGTVTAFSPNIYAFMVLRFLQGIFLPGCGITNWVLAYESIPMLLRRYAPLVFGLFWVGGYCTLAPMAYFFQHWRHLMLATSIPALVAGLLYSAILPESFHFLVSRGRTEAVESWIKKADKLRFRSQPSVGNPEHIAEACVRAHSAVGKSEIDTENAVPGTELCSELWKRKRMLLYTIIAAYLWTCDSFVYYGLSLISTSSTLSGDKYVNYAMSGVAEIPSYVLSPYLLDKMGRRGFVSFTHFLTMISFIGVIVIENASISLVLWLIGKFGISCAYTAMYVYGSEIFPTVLRSGIIGICVLLERTGGLLAPTSLIEPHLPNIFFAATSGLAAALTLFLPETRGKELPDLATEVADATSH